MNKVTIINLAGKAFHLEEPGFEKLSAYLESAKRTLEGNPDQSEIMRDLEEAIADKCAKFLHAHKTVVLTSEIESVIAEMGPVNPADEDAAYDERKESPRGPKRLYQLREGAMIAGVCAGLAAYFSIDVTIVRIAFVLLTLFTSGVWILVYFIMMLVVPYANTNKERAAAYGEAFNAQEILDRAKAHYADFKNNKEWKENWRKHKQQWKREWKQTAQMRWQRATPSQQHPVSKWLLILLGFINAVITTAFLLAIICIISTGLLFGLLIPFALPTWTAVLILIVIYKLVTWPFRIARISMHADAYRGGWFDFVDGVMWLAIVAILGWIAYAHLPFFHRFIDQIPGWWQIILAKINATHALR